MIPSFWLFWIQLKVSHSNYQRKSNIPSEATFAIKIESQSFLINFVTSNMNLSVKEKQDLLAINELKGRFRDAKIYEYRVAKT
jgi:ATP-dependent Lon protease